MAAGCHTLALFDRDSLMEIDMTFAPGHNPVNVSDAMTAGRWCCGMGKEHGCLLPLFRRGG